MEWRLALLGQTAKSENLHSEFDRVADSFFAPILPKNLPVKEKEYYLKDFQSLPTKIQPSRKLKV